MIDYSGFNRLTTFGFGRDMSLDEMAEAFDANELAKAYYVLDFLNARIDKVKKKQEAIDEMTYEKDLLERDVISIVKDDLANSRFNIFRMLSPSDLLWHAWRYFNCKKNGNLDELRKSDSGIKDFESAFNLAENVVMNNLIPEKMHEGLELVGICDYNYSAAYEFEYEYNVGGKKVAFTIHIPMFSSAYEKTYMDMILGYALKYPEGECVIGHAFYEIDPTKFKERLGEWVEKRLKGEENGD